KLVMITDNLSFASPADASGETFTTLKTAAFAEVLRGVVWVPLTTPTAVAGANSSAYVGHAVNLDGSGSSSPYTPSASLQYAWSFFSTPGGSTATLSGAATSTPSFTPDVAGSYVVQLVVTDPITGLVSAPSQATITVNRIPTTLTYNGAATQDYNDAATLSATL